MNALPAVAWSPRRWALVLAGGLLAHFGLTFWLGERARPAGVVATPEPVLRMVPELPSFGPTGSPPAWSDPTLFSLPSHQGFSGEAWLRFSPAPALPGVWSEPPSWLPLDTGDLGAAPSRYLAANHRPASVLDQLLKTPTTAADVLLLNDALTTQSVLRAEGPLAARPLVRPVALPSPACSDVLPDTVLQVRVSPEGFVESAIQLSSCGLESADEEALRVARSVQFEPVAPEGNGARPEWGRLLFQWFTVPAPATNAPAVK